MPVRIVQSKQNARLKQLRRALAHPLSEFDREGRPLVGIEGPNLLYEALRAGLRIECLFAAERAEHLLETIPLPRETEILLLPSEVLNSALSTESPQPIAALVEPPDWTWAHIISSLRKTPPLLLVLAGIQDPGNLGTILRSAEAFGADGVLCLPGTVSPWNPKAVRASAGSIFRLPLQASSEKACFDSLREAGIRIFTSAVRGVAQPANLVDLTEPVALLIGNEGNGVTAELAKQADGTITIPCPGPVESLNASIAASVLLYEASRQRFLRSCSPADHRGGQ